MTDKEKVRIEAFEEALKAVESWRTKDHDEVLYRNSQKGRYSGFPAGIDAAEGAIANLILREKGELPRQDAAESLPASVVQEVCPSCEGRGTEADYVGLEMRCVEVECSRCGGKGKPEPPASTNSPAIPAKEEAKDKPTKEREQKATLPASMLEVIIAAQTVLGMFTSGHNPTEAQINRLEAAIYGASQPSDQRGRLTQPKTL